LLGCSVALVLKATWLCLLAFILNSREAAGLSELAQARGRLHFVPHLSPGWSETPHGKTNGVNVKEFHRRHEKDHFNSVTT